MNRRTNNMLHALERYSPAAPPAGVRPWKPGKEEAAGTEGKLLKAPLLEATGKVVVPGPWGALLLWGKEMGKPCAGPCWPEPTQQWEGDAEGCYKQ